MTTKPENTGLNLAVIGCGRWGKNHVRAASEQFGDRLRWICDIDEGRRSSLSDLTLASRFTTDVRDVLDDESTHAVIIATPAETHYALARDALEAGKHILVEKPMALVSGHARELAHLADKAERVLMPGHLLLFHPAIVKIREMIEEGTLGRLQYVYSNRLNLGSVRKHENILWSFAPHDISVLRYLTGADPIDVSAQGSVFLQPGTHDVTITHLSYPGNVHAHIHVSWLHPFKEHRLVVIGDKNMIVFEDTHEHDKLLLYNKGIDWIHGEPHLPRQRFERSPLRTGGAARRGAATFLGVRCYRRAATGRCHKRYRGPGNARKSAAIPRPPLAVGIQRAP